MGEILKANTTLTSITMECLIVPSRTVGIELSSVLCSDANSIVYIGGITDACSIVTESDAVMYFLIIGQLRGDANNAIVVDIVTGVSGIQNYTIGEYCLCGVLSVPL